MQNAPLDHFAILLTCIKRSQSLNTYFCLLLECLLKVGLTVLRSSLIMSKILVLVSFENWNLYRNSWSRSSSKELDLSLRCCLVRGMFSIYYSLRKLSIIEENKKNIIQIFSSRARGRYHPNSTFTSLFEAPSSSSEGCAYRFEPLLANLSERWDYLNEFEWSARRV